VRGDMREQECLRCQQDREILLQEERSRASLRRARSASGLTLLREASDRELVVPKARPISSSATQTVGAAAGRPDSGLHRKLARSRALLGPPPPSRALLGPPPPPPTAQPTLTTHTTNPTPLKVTFAQSPATVIRAPLETEEETETEPEERGLNLADESNYLPGRSQVLSSGQETDSDYSYAYRWPSDSPLPPSHALLSPALQIQREAMEEESNIYEEIRRPGIVLQGEEDAEESDSDSTTNSENSFFLSISRGRRRHLQLHRFADWDLGSEEPISQRRGRVSFEIDTEQQQPKKMKLESVAEKRRDQGQRRFSSRERIESEKVVEAGLLEQVHRLGRRLSRKVSVAFGLRS